MSPKSRNPSSGPRQVLRVRFTELHMDCIGIKSPQMYSTMFSMLNVHTGLTGLHHEMKRIQESVAA